MVYGFGASNARDRDDVAMLDKDFRSMLYIMVKNHFERNQHLLYVLHLAHRVVNMVEQMVDLVEHIYGSSSERLDEKVPVFIELDE
ncbi:MAG: hypothetical protein M1829_001663 [Trizodia sp. TS-e1964]|nr:MAG: hypothetical protein M1829_001663 [Trizodia sp. TS-e1964]